MTPSYLSNLIPNTHEQNHRYRTRNSSHLVQPPCKLNFYYNDFIPSTVRLWNNLPQDIKDIDSLSLFKKALLPDGDTIPSFFHTGSRQDQILHAWLRMKCSSLKEHLYLKNIEPSPLCTCGEVESTSHYLLYCRKYDQERHSLFTSLNMQPPLSVLLYGDKNCSLQYNEHLFISVQKFIMQTSRFS